jgi:Putative auto-transporter adhesin, head GIN domain
MAQKLATIAVIGLTASAVCMGAAAAIGGRNFGEGLGDFSLFDSKPRCEVLAGATATNRTIDWDGSDHVGLAVNSHASYAPGSDGKVHVSGDPQVLAHLRVRDGNIEMNCRGWRDRIRDLAITLPGRNFRKFAILGGGNLALDRLDQDNVKIEIDGAGDVKANGKIDDLKMTINGSGNADFDQLVSRQAKAEIHGSGSIRAKGKVDDLEIEIAGSGRADFGQVASRNAEVEIGGHGDVDIAPSEEAKIRIGGSGDVYLHSNPKSLDTKIGGSGRIHRVAPGI